eukprot:s1620_g12.t1
MDIPAFVWQSMSTKARRAAIRDEQKKIAEDEVEKKRKARAREQLEKLEKSTKGVASIVNELHEAYQSEDEIPAMPTCKYTQERHRVKCARVSIRSGEKIINTLVARPVNKKEIRSNPKAQESLDIEWNKLVKKTAWLYDTVSEWSTISTDAKKKGKKVHVGKVFEICVEKGSELPEGHKLRKFKGRTVFQGNNVKDENADVALFSELGSSPATMEAGKSVDAYGSQPGYVEEQNDGVQAYTQALMEGIETWVELPIDRWPTAWRNRFKRPVVRLRIALYGHPDSGGLWEIHCERMSVEVGFIMPDPEGWPSVFYHPQFNLLLVVYVDDFKMAGPKEPMSKGWQLIGSRIDMDVPTDVGRYLGCDHVREVQVMLTVHDHPFAYLFDKSLPDPAAKDATAAQRTQDLWEVDASRGHMDELLQSHVKKMGIAGSFELGRYNALQTQNAINGSALSKLEELVGVLMKLEMGLQFKFSDLKGSLQRCCLQFPDLRNKVEESKRCDYEGNMASALLCVCAHTRRLKDATRFREACPKCTDYEKKELLEMKNWLSQVEKTAQEMTKQLGKIGCACTGPLKK